METDFNVVICDRCKKPITVVSYIRVSGAVILQEYFEPIPPLYRCKEHAENYAKFLSLHDDCWMATLTDHGVKINDMTEILARMRKEVEDKNKEVEVK